MSAKMKMECPYFTLRYDLHTFKYPQLFGCQISNSENLNNILRLFGQNINVPEELGFQSMKVFFDLKEKLLFMKAYFDYKDQSQQQSQCKVKKVTFLLAQQGCRQTDFKIKIAVEVYSMPFSLIIYKNELKLPDIKNIVLSLGVKAIDRMNDGLQGIKIKQKMKKKLMTNNPVSKKLIEKALVQVQQYENKVKTSIKAQIKGFKEQLEQTQQERYLINKGQITISKEDMTNLITSFYYKNQDVRNNNENLQQAINDNQNVIQRYYREEVLTRFYQGSKLFKDSLKQKGNAIKKQWKALVTCTKSAAFLKQHLKDYEIKTKKPITLKEVLKMIPLLDQSNIIPQEILENITIKQFIFSLKDSECQYACLKLLIHQKWVIIKDSIELTDIEFMVDYQKDSGIQAAMMHCKFKDFEIIGSYKKDKDWHFMGKTKSGNNNFNPFRALGYYDNLPAWLQEITTMDEVYIFFNKQGEIQITLESKLDLDIFQFGDLKIFRLQNYRFELCKNSMELSLKLQGNLTLLGMDIAFDAQYLSNKEKDIVILGTVTKDYNIVELLQQLEQNDQEDEIAHSSLIIKEGSFVLIDSKLKKFEIKSRMGLRNINLVIFQNDSSNKTGFHLFYDFLEEKNFALFNDWGIEKVQVSYCSLTCIRVNMKKSPLTIEVDIELSKNEFTKNVKECLDYLTGQDFKILKGIYQYKGKKMIKLPFDFKKVQLQLFDIFFLKIENFEFIPDGFECNISLTIDTQIKKIDQTFNAIYKNGKLTFEYTLQTFKLKILPGLQLQNLSLYGKIFPHPQQISVRCDSYLLNNDQPSEFSFDPKRQRFRVVIAQGQMLALSVIWEILTGEKVFQKLQKIIDFVKIMPLTDNDSIVLAFNGKTDFEIKCKISIHQAIIIKLDLKVSFFSGINAFLELDPIHIFDSLIIASVKDETKGPQLRLQMQPFQKKFNLTVSGLFKYQDLQFNSHIKLEPDLGLMFTVRNTLNIYSLVKTCSNFDILINYDGFSFDADFLFLLNIKKSEETEFEVFGHKYKIPKFEVIGAEFNTRIKLLNKHFYIKGSLSLSLLGVELKFEDLEFSIYECSFKQLSLEMVQEILKQFQTLIMKIAQEKLSQLGQAIKEYLKKGWNQIISISKSAVSFFKDFFKKILEKKSEANGHGTSFTEEQIETISSSMAKKVGRQFSKQLIKEKHYDEAFAVLASEDDSILSSDGRIDQEELYQKAQQLKSSRKKVVFWNKIKEYSSDTQNNNRVEESMTQIQNAEEQLAKEQNEGEEEPDSGDDEDLDLKQYTLDGCNYSEKVTNEEISKNEEEKKESQQEEEKSKKAVEESFFERWLKGDLLQEIFDQQELDDEQKNQQKDISNQQEIQRTQAKSTPIIIEKIVDYGGEEEKQLENLETNCEIDLDNEEELLKKAIAISKEESEEVKDPDINKINNKYNAQKQNTKDEYEDENGEDESEQKLLEQAKAISMVKDKEIEDIYNNNNNNKQTDEEFDDDELQIAKLLSLEPLENDNIFQLQKQINDTPDKQSIKPARIETNHQIEHHFSEYKGSVNKSSKDIEESKESESLTINGEGSSQSLEEEKESQGLKEAQHELLTQDPDESEQTRPIPQITQEQLNYLQEQVKEIEEKINQKDIQNLKETDTNAESANLAGSPLNKEGSSVNENSKLTIQQIIQKIEELQNSIKILESKFTEATEQQNSSTQKEEEKYSINEYESLQNFGKVEDILAEFSDDKLDQMDIEELREEINKCEKFNERLSQRNQDSEYQNQLYKSERKSESNGKCNCGKPMRPQQIGNITIMKETCICGKDGRQVKKFGSNIHGFEA